jgi:3-oxoacyl-[acyl-carrier-protein] synthase II
LDVIRRELQCDAPATCLAAACASGVVGVGFAADQIKAGLTDVCVVIGADVLSRVAVVGFKQVGAMSLDGCRPFHRHRDGTTVGEGGAALLMTSSEVAREYQAARVRGVVATGAVRISGYGMTCDARHAVEPTAAGIEKAIRAALDEAHIKPEEVACVYWHGTGTIQNDAAEAQAAAALFSAPPPGSGTKGVFGHSMGASGLLNVAAAVESLKTGILPAAYGLDSPAFPEMNIVANKATVVTDGPALVVALGFGGINSAAVLETVNAV